jgi:hypothetical protein
MGGVAGEEEHITRTLNVNSQRHYPAARSLLSYTGNVSDLHIMRAYFCLQESDVGKMHSLVPVILRIT